MDAMDGASAADNGSDADAVAVASLPSAGLAAPSGAGVITNASSEMAPKPVPVAGRASSTGSEDPQAEDDQMKQAVAANDTKCDDDKEGRLAVDVPQKGADGDVQKGSSSVKDGAATASVTPIAGAAEIPAVEDVTDAGRACKKSNNDVDSEDENDEEHPTWSTDDLVVWQNPQSGTGSDGSGCNAIDACSNFIKKQLMTKNCADILSIQGSDAFHVCTCMKSLGASLARPVATFVAVTWANMSEDEKIDQLHQWMYGPPYGSFELPMDSDPMDDDHAQLPSPSESRLICNNALIELLGISSDLWQKALDREVEDGAQEEAVASSGIDQDRSPTNKGKRRAKMPTINSILYMRKSGKGYQSDQQAIDACEAFIRTNLLTKTCTSPDAYSTKCKCMQRLASGIESDSNNIRYAATYVATNWYNMSDEEKAAQTVKWIRDKANSSRLQFMLPGTNEKMICRNALCEVLGISYKEWRNAVKLENPSGGESGRVESTLLKTFDSMIQSAGPRAVEVCSNFIRSYLVRKTCCNVAKYDRTQCTCLQTLTPDQIHQSASYVATVWYNMTQEEKLNQLKKWIQQKEEEGALPYLLPLGESTETADAPKNICRNALCEVLFVPTSWWKKAEKLAKPTSRPLCSVGGCTRQSQGLRYKGMCQSHYNEKKMGAESTSDDLVSRTSAGSTQVTENPSNGSDATDTPRTPFAVVLEKPMGLTLTQRGKIIRVTEIKPGSVAEKSGKVSIGNFVLAVNETGVINKDLTDVVDMIDNGGSSVNILFSTGDSEQHEEKTNNPSDGSHAVDAPRRIESLSKMPGALMANHCGTYRGTKRKTNDYKHLLRQAKVAGKVPSFAPPSCTPFAVVLEKPMGLTLTQKGKNIRVSEIKPGIDAQEGQASHSNAKQSKTEVAPTNAAVTVAQSETHANDPNDKAAGDQELPSKGVKNVGEEASLPNDRNIVAAPAERSLSGAAASVGRGQGAATGKSWPKCTAGIYGALNKMVETSGPYCVEAYSRYIRSYVMQQPCYDWVSSTCTGCFCTKSLSPSQIFEAAFYVTATWYKKSDEEKMAQLVLWIQGKKSGDLPFLLPSRRVGSAGEPKRLCRGAFMKLLFVPASMWRKAEARALPSAAIDPTESAASTAVATVVDSPRGDRAGVSASASATFVTPSPPKKGATNKCSVEGCSKYMQSKCNEMCRAHYLESRMKADNSIDIANSGRRRAEPRKPTKSHCGTCDACMVDECGECKYCLDMPRFGGDWKLRQKCLNRPACIVHGSSKSASTATIYNETDDKSARKSGGKRKRSESTLATEYTPPTIRVGEKIMKFFTDDFYEGKVERLPTKASSLFFVVYSDGDREELDEDGFWATYSDFRVQKGLVEPSEFVPDSLVVANDGRLAVVRSFRPVSNGIDTTWSYRVHFTGWSATFDKWMLEVDLRKQTKSTLKWAEKVRTSLGIKDRSKKKVEREGASATPASKGALNESVEVRQMMKPTPRPSRGDNSYLLGNVPSPETKKSASLMKTLRSSELKHSIKSAKVVTVESISTKRPAKAAKAKSIPSKSIGCDVVMRQYPLRSSEPHLRRAAVHAKRKLSTPRKDASKQAKKVVQRKNLSSKPRRTGDKKANVVDAENYILPAIVVGTSILKYFVEGKDYFEGKITKLPTSAKNFYRIRYQDGDEEDMDPLELYMAFSDWCVANNEIPLTKFNPNQHVYGVDRGGVVREAVILSFCPVIKPGCMPGDWSWSYRVHFVGWHKRHDEWLDEDRLRKMSGSSTKEKFQKEMDKQRALQTEASAKESAKVPTKQASTGQKRGREAAVKAKATPSVRKYRWRCHRCDGLNAPNHTKCSTCRAWKGGKMPRKEESEVVEVLDESEEEDESSEEEKKGPAASRRCSVEGCNKYKQKRNDGMCRSHFLESQEANEDESSEEEEEEEESSGDESSGEEESSEEEEEEEEESSDEEDMLNWRQRKRLTCAIEGCTRLRQFGQRGTLCKLHFLEAHEEAENSGDNDSDDDSGDEADSNIVAEDNIGDGNEEGGTKEMEGDKNGAFTCAVGTTRPCSVVTACSGSSGILSGGQNSGESNLMDMINILKDSDDEDDNDDEDLFA